MFVKAGTILPILNHFHELSLSHALKNNVKLQVFLDEHLQASGELILDDGVSLDTEYLRVKLRFSDGKLALSCLGGFVSDKVINRIELFGVTKEPVHVSSTSFYKNNSIVVTESFALETGVIL
jgi:alpha-glucosidase (family GH31 glycosyl hydrolase)